MTELVMMEAALFQLRAALGDDPQNVPVRLAAGVLANAIATAKEEGINPARVNDIEFALNDLVAASDDAGVGDEARTAVAMLQKDAAALRQGAELPDEVIGSIRELQDKLRTRARALERNQYRAEDAPEAPLPHPPEELREEAIPLARQLAGAGFETPALDLLIADPESLRYHSINEIVDELDVIAR